MPNRGILAGAATVEVDLLRYDELLAKEERLRMLESAIKRQSDYSTLLDIKKVFDLAVEATEKDNEQED